MQIDISKLGYRWRGLYGEGLTYQKGDVVRKDNKVQAWSGSSWTTLGVGQMNATQRGELATAGSAPILTGVQGQELFVTVWGDIEFRFSDGRRGSGAKDIMSYHNTGMTDYYYGGTSNGFAIMTDGSVKGWGDQRNGKVGDGVIGDRARSLPVDVAFPPGTPPIIYVHGISTKYAIDAKGGLWSWGWNAHGAVGDGTTTDRSTPFKMNGSGDLPSDAIVTSVKSGSGGWYNYGVTMFQTIDGRVYVVGHQRYNAHGTLTGNAHTFVPRLIPRSLDIKVVDYFPWGHYHMATWLLDDQGRLWGAGEQNSIGRINNNENPDVKHELWQPSVSNPVKTIRGHESDEHINAGDQYYRRYMIIHVNGQITTWGHNSIYNVTSYVGSHQVETWWPTLDPRIDGVVDAFVTGGWYAQQTVLRNDGTVWAIGYDGHSISGGSGNLNNWTQITQLGGGNIQLHGGGARYGKWGAVLRDDGTAQCWGAWYAGNGAGDFNGIHDRDDWYGGTVKLNKPIVKFLPYGHQYDGSSWMSAMCLTEDGNVFTFGSSDYAKLGLEDDNENMSVPSPVLL